MRNILTPIIMDKKLKNSTIRLRLIISIVIILGITILFFFPKPETNFLAYSITALSFITLIIFLIIIERKN